MTRLVLLALVLCAAPRFSVAQNIARAGTIVIAHGGDSLWNAQVIDAAKAARTGGPVEVSFLVGPAVKATRVQERRSAADQRTSNVSDAHLDS